MSPDLLAAVAWALIIIFTLLPLWTLFSANGLFGPISREQKIVAAQEKAQNICSLIRMILEADIKEESLALTIRLVPGEMDKMIIYFLADHPDFKTLKRMKRFEFIRFEYTEHSYSGARLTDVASYLQMAR
jgi:hypothetical protein